MKGLCPVCRKVIDSSSKRCEHCGTMIKLSMVPKEDRATGKEMMQEALGLYLAQVIFVGLGVIVAMFFNLIIGIVLILVGCCFIPAWSRATLRVSLEKMYASLPDAAKREKEKPAVKQTASYMEELADLKKLLDSGVITQEEYDAKKRQVLKL